MISSTIPSQWPKRATASAPFAFGIMTTSRPRLHDRGEVVEARPRHPISATRLPLGKRSQATRPRCTGWPHGKRELSGRERLFGQNAINCIQNQSFSVRLALLAQNLIPAMPKARPRTIVCGRRVSRSGSAVEVLARHSVEVENVIRAKGQTWGLEPRLDLSGRDAPSSVEGSFGGQRIASRRPQS